MSRPALIEKPVVAKAEFPAFMARRPYWWLVLFCLCAWLPGFFSLMPTDRDESRFAQASKQMIESGDYVRIMNGTEARNKKPIGIYWAQVPFARAAAALGGEPLNRIWPYRLPSLLGALAAVLATALGGAGLIGRERALRAGFWLGSCLLLLGEAHIAKTDAALCGATSVAMLLLGRAYLGREAVSRGQALGFWAAVAAGILLKGPVAPMIIGLAVVSLGLASGRWRWLLHLRPGSGIALLLVLVLPWFIAIGFATHGAFFAQSLGGKLAGSDDAHGRPPGFYLLLLPLVAFPAALPLLRALPSAWGERGRDEVRFLLAWLLPNWVVFEIVHTKLPHYVLPLYPALFLLASLLADRPVGRGWRWGSAGLAALGGVALVVGFAVAPLRLGGAWWVGLPLAVVLGAMIALMLAGRQGAALLLLPLAMLALFDVELPGLPALAVSPRIEARLVADGLNRREIASLGYAEPSLMFLAGTGITWANHPPVMVAWAWQHPDGVALIEAGYRGAFLAEVPNAVLRDEVDGFDYSNNHQVRIGIYTLEKAK